MSCGARTSSCLVHTLSHNLPFELERYYRLLHGHGPSMGTQALSLLVFYLVLGFLASCLSSAHSLVADPWHPASSTSRLVTCLWLQHSPAHGRHEFYRQAVGGGAATLELSSALNVRCMRVRGPFSSLNLARSRPFFFFEHARSRSFFSKNPMSSFKLVKIKPIEGTFHYNFHVKDFFQLCLELFQIWLWALSVLKGFKYVQNIL